MEKKQYFIHIISCPESINVISVINKMFIIPWLILLLFFFYMNIVHTNKQNKKLQSPGALNIQKTPGYKLKENIKK